MRGEEQLARAGKTYAVRGADVLLVPQHQLRRKQAVLEQPTGAVDVTEHEVEQLGPLGQCTGQPSPLVLAEHDGQRVEDPPTGLSGLLARDEIADAVVLEQPAPLLAAGQKSFNTKRFGGAGDLLPGWTDRAVADELIRCARRTHAFEVGPQHRTRARGSHRRHSGWMRRRSRVRRCSAPSRAWRASSSAMRVRSMSPAV